MRPFVLFVAVGLTTAACGDAGAPSERQTKSQARSAEELRWKAIAEAAEAKGETLGVMVSGPGYEGIVLSCEPSPAGCWEPTAEDITRFEQALVDFRDHRERPDLASLAEYRRHYAGSITNGAKQIRVHLFHDSTDYVRSRAWRSVRAGFMGGGSKYLTALYDPQANEVASVQPNAPM